MKFKAESHTHTQKEAFVQKSITNVRTSNLYITW